MEMETLILNLPHRADRKFVMLGHLETIGFPLEKVRVFESHYGGDYDSREAVKQAADADGFHFFNKPWIQDDNLNYLASLWTWCGALREIMNAAHHVLLVIDDRFLKISYEILTMTAQYLLDHHSPLDILQLGWTHLWKEPYDRVEHVTGLVGRGIRSNGDYVLLLSADGAKRIYDIIEKHFYSPEAIMYRLAQPDVDRKGLFHFMRSVVTGSGLSGHGDIF